MGTKEWTMYGRLIPHIHGVEMLKAPSGSYSHEELLGKMPRLRGNRDMSIFLGAFMQSRPQISMFEVDYKKWYSGMREQQIAKSFKDEIENVYMNDRHGNRKKLNGQEVTKKDG